MKLRSLVNIEEGEEKIFLFGDSWDPDERNVTWVEGFNPKTSKICGSESCYELSKRTNRICEPIFDQSGLSVLDELSSKIDIKFSFDFIFLIGLAGLILSSSLIGFGVWNYAAQEGAKTKETDYLFETQFKSGSSMFQFVGYTLKIIQYNLFT